MCTPISSLLRKGDGPVTWTAACEIALNTCITAITTGGLMLACFDRPFIIYSDFSCGGIGAVLAQEVDGKEFPIMFASRLL